MKDDNFNVLTKINKKAILYGFLTNLGGIVAIIVMSIIIGITVAIKKGSPEDLELITQGPLVLIMGFVISSVFLVLGGFVTARTAKYFHIKHVLYLAIIFLLIFISAISISVLTGEKYNVFQIVYNVFVLLSILPLTLLGGHLAIKSIEENN